MSLGLYIHVPFCTAICNYCNFNRGLFDAALKTKYVGAVLEEIRRAGDGSAADTIFFGGGTPSLLEPAEIGAQRIGHFGFFRPYCESLWKECVRWLEAAPGTTDSGRQREVYERSDRHRETSHDKRGQSRRRSVLARGSRT